MLLNNKITGKNDMKHYMGTHGIINITHHRKVNVSVCGSGKKVILLLARKTSPFPILEMKALIYYLQEKFKVVALDYLGSGYSDDYHTERTLDNITSEIHEVMLSLGYTNYIVAAHAYAGLYSLYYANKYADEVKAVIGIDSFVAEQIDDDTNSEKSKFCRNMWLDYHKSQLLQWCVKKAASYHLNRADREIYTSEEVKTYSNLARHRLAEMTLLERYDCYKENFDSVRGLQIPINIPMLCILSSYRNKKIHNWYDLHQKLSENSDSKIVTLKGGKNLHLKQPKRLAEEIRAFLL